MPEYIDRSAVLEALRVVRAGTSEMLTVQSMPAAEVEPVRHGRWVEDGDYIICPECQKRWNIYDNDTETFNRCPNCGAKMDQDQG